VSTVGDYVLILFMPSEATLEVGKLGTLTFPPGYYCYAGSARGPGGLLARLGRHVRKRKELHWHIDYLLVHANIVEIWHAPSVERQECRWSRAILALPGVESAKRGFGSSDCGCRTHLAYLLPSSLPTVRSYMQALGAALWSEGDIAVQR
jgi:Uri superfamily endonuclease